MYLPHTVYVKSAEKTEKRFLASCVWIAKQRRERNDGVNEYASEKGCGVEGSGVGVQKASRPVFCWGYRDFSVLFSVLPFKGKYGEKTAKAVTEENGAY
jgi:hypothetical protein